MKTVKTSELIGTALDWAVAKCEGVVSDDVDDFCLSVDGEFNYSTNWALGGPIIDREFICTNGDDGALNTPASWDASIFDDGEFIEFGPTALIAAMRCYVAWKLGDEIEVPEELL